MVTELWTIMLGDWYYQTKSWQLKCVLELCKVRIAMNNIKLFPQPHHCTVNWKIIKLLLTFNNYAPTSFTVTWNFSAFFIQSVKLTFWTVIHPTLHNGEHSCLCAWADGPAPPSGDSEHREPVYTSLWGTHLMVRRLILWYRGVRWYPCWDIVGSNPGFGNGAQSE